MIALSIILILAGAASLVYGFVENSNMERQLESLFSCGSINPGTVWIIIGAIALVLGIIVLAIHLFKKKQNS